MELLPEIKTDAIKAIQSPEVAKSEREKLINNWTSTALMKNSELGGKLVATFDPQAMELPTGHTKGRGIAEYHSISHHNYDKDGNSDSIGFGIYGDKSSLLEIYTTNMYSREIKVTPVLDSNGTVDRMASVLEVKLKEIANAKQLELDNVKLTKLPQISV